MNNLPAICPRCDGTMLPTQRDPHGEFRVCLSCGYYADRLVGPPLGDQPRRLMLPIYQRVRKRAQMQRD